MYTIKVQGHFSSAHNLRGYRGKCEKLHGHNWKVEAQICAGRLNKLGMACDFKQVKDKLEKILSRMDHNYLNKLTYFEKNNPTSERIAEFIYFNLKKLIKDKRIKLKSVAVWETESSQAVFSEED